MKKLMATVTACVTAVCAFASCKAQSQSPQPPKDLELRIVTAYGSDDGNNAAYTSVLEAFEKQTGVKVIDDSSAANEEWKAKVNGDFQTDSEPDILMYFTGYDANEIIRSGKVVPIKEIKAQYPSYASNMREEMMPPSIVDGQFYAVPVNGYWEGLFVNKSVLQKCGIDEVPNASTTWAEFMDMCEQIKQAGYTPIAVSLLEVPHYLIEYTVFNEGNPSIHTKPPLRVQDSSAQRWINGITTIKKLYEKGYFPQNTLTATDSDTFWQFCSGSAAFAIDGSWRIGWLAGSYDENGNKTGESRVTNIDDFTVTYVPGNDNRQTTDIISGISMGYFITRRAWDNPEKRDAAVKLVEMLTSDSVITTLSQGAPTALVTPSADSFKETPVHIAAQELLAGATSSTNAAQDFLSKPTRTYLFGSMKDIVTGKISVYDAVDTAISAPMSSEVRTDN